MPLHSQHSTRLEQPGADALLGLEVKHDAVHPVLGQRPEKPAADEQDKRARHGDLAGALVGRVVRVLAHLTMPEDVLEDDDGVVQRARLDEGVVEPGDQHHHGQQNRKINDRCDEQLARADPFAAGGT